jgi:hypothetical protein
MLSFHNFFGIFDCGKRKGKSSSVLKSERYKVELKKGANDLKILDIFSRDRKQSLRKESQQGRKTGSQQHKQERKTL